MRELGQDAALAAGMLAACVLVNNPHHMVAAVGPGTVVWWWVATALALLAVSLRRRWSLPMLGLVVLAAAVHVALAVPPMVVDLGVLVLLYTVAARRPRVVSAAGLAGLLLLVTGWSGYHAFNGRPVPGLPTLDFHVSHLPEPAAGRDGATVRGGGTNPWGGLSVIASVLVASWAVGSGARSRRAYLDQLHARAQDLERERDQQAALAVAAERGRISREMHDVVAHGLSVIVIQAQGGAAALDRRPADTYAALAAIVRTGRDCIADMRRVLAAVGEVDDAWHPQPGLAQLPALLAQVRTAGTRVRLRVEGEPAPLPSSTDLSAYRIVQEALTNTMKHAATGATATVVVSYGDAEVGIEVSDDGPGPAGHDGGGNGLRGMRERVQLLGGRLTAAPGPGGGFTVRATLPLAGWGG
ncbi:sensor histidine kinase [Dactylosporangium cerinum]|uniref:histidine kinase n=1 Tax=Dactylosporangium cerinum TaxID=1434730 RepID=A0ABV9VPW6_9ACTN